MSRASLNNFVGLFGRQAPIGLNVPQWVTVYVPDWKREWNQSRMDFLDGLIEGFAIIGAVGCTVVFNIEASEWNRAGLEDIEDRLGSLARRARPYFRVVAANQAAAAQAHADGDILCAGRLVAQTQGEPFEVPDFLAGREFVVVDYKTTMIAKTSRPQIVMQEALEFVADPEVRALPHWQESWSATLLDTTLGLLAVNVLAKPVRFRPDTFFFASDYLDETVAQAFNDRALRANWSKPARGAVPQSPAEEATNA